MAAVSLRRMAVPAGSGLGLESRRIFRRGRSWAVEASDWSVDALRWRHGGNRSSTSAGRERQDADELVGGTVCGDAARSYEYADAGKHRSLESGEGSGARCDAKPIGGGERSCSRGANHGIESSLLRIGVNYRF